MQSYWSSRNGGGAQWRRIELNLVERGNAPMEQRIYGRRVQSAWSSNKLDKEGGRRRSCQLAM